jgi:PKHD-type hydroxylase
VARDIRDARSIRLPYDKGIGATMAGIGMAANRKHWRFDITHADQCEFLCYEKEGHYVGHVDTFMQRDGDCRKLTVLAILNDEFEGGRFWIKGSGDDRVYPVQTKGSVIVFPSFMLHGVEPVTLGPRYSLVTWLVGPWFR